MEPITTVDEAVAVIKTYVGRTEKFTLPISDWLFYECFPLKKLGLEVQARAMGFRMDAYKQKNGYCLYLFRRIK